MAKCCQRAYANKYPDTLLVHNGETNTDIAKNLSSNLHAIRVDHAVIPDEVPAGTTRYSYICELLDSFKSSQNRTKPQTPTLILVILSEKCGGFLDFVIEQGIETCLMIPIRQRGVALPRLISHLSSIELQDEQLLDKLLKSLGGQPISDCKTKLLGQYVELMETSLSLFQPIAVKFYASSNNGSRIPNTKTDECVKIHYQFTRQGRAKKNNLDVKIVPEITVAEEDGGLGVIGQSQNPVKPSDVVFWWRDTESKKDGEERFWFRFRQQPVACHVYVRFNLEVCEMDPCSSNTGEDRQYTKVDSKCVHFKTSAKKMLKVEKKERVHLSGNEGDVEEDKVICRRISKKTQRQHRQRNKEQISNPNKIELRDLEIVLYESKSRFCKNPKKRIFKSTGVFANANFQNMMSNLETLGEGSTDGFTEFHNTASEYLTNWVDSEIPLKYRIDAKVAIFIKMAGIAHYRGKWEDAKTQMKEARRLLKNSNTISTARLEARLCYYMSAVYRERKVFGKAEEWINRAQEKLDKVDPCVDTAKGYYNAGKLYMKMLTHSKQAADGNSSAYQQKAVECLLMAIQHWCYEAEPDQKQIRRCLLNLSSTVIHSPQTVQGRDRHVTQGQVDEAKRIHRHLGSKVLNGRTESMRHQIQVWISESEVFFREYCLKVEKCPSFKNGSPVSHKCNCSKNGDCSKRFQECPNMREGLISLRTCLKRIDVAIEISNKYALKDGKSAQPFAKEIEQILFRYQPDRIADEPQTSSESSTGISSCHSNAGNTEPDGSASDQGPYRAIGIDSEDISDAYQSDASAISNL